MVYQNNPFNIRYNSINKWKGLIGSKNGFCEFSTVDYGLRAGLIVLRTYVNRHGFKTPKEIIERYAPKTENNVQNYLSYCLNGRMALVDVPFQSRLMFFMFVQNMLYFESNYYITLAGLLKVANKYNIHYNF